MILALYLFTTIIPIIIIWDIDDNSTVDEKIILSFACLVPILPIPVLIISLFVDLILGDFPKFKNPFKSKRSKYKQNKQKKQFEPTFADLAKAYPTEWIKQISNDISFPFKIKTLLGSLQSNLLSKKDSPYYAGSLLGSLEEMLINWCDGMFTIEQKAMYRDFKPYTGYKCYAKQAHFSHEALEFLQELLTASQIPYNWILEQEQRAKDEEESIRNNRNKQLTDVVKSMKADLEKIYNVKGEK